MNRCSKLVLACSLVALPAAALAAELPALPADSSAAAEALAIDAAEPPAVESAPPEPVPAAQQCPPEGCEEEPSPFYCQENDNGKNPSIAGTLWFFYYGQIIAVYNDACLNGTNLREYWCSSSSNWTTTTYWCLNGCSAGRCL